MEYAIVCGEIHARVNLQSPFQDALSAQCTDLTDKPLKCYEPRVYLSLHAGRTTICYPIEGMNPTKGVSPMTTVSCRKSDCDCAPAGVA